MMTINSACKFIHIQFLFHINNILFKINVTASLQLLFDKDYVQRYF